MARFFKCICYFCSSCEDVFFDEENELHVCEECLDLKKLNDDEEE